MDSLNIHGSLDHSNNNHQSPAAKLSPGLNRQEQKTRIAFLQNEQAELETEIRLG